MKTPSSAFELIAVDAINALKNAAIREFTVQILHGDKEHQDWLLKACQDYIDGKPIAKP